MIIAPIVVIAIIVLIFLYASIKVLREYERGVVFTLGRYTGLKGPGLILLYPFIQQMVRVDLRVVVDEVPPQDVISHDNVSVKVSAVIYFRVVDAEKAIIQVSNYLAATSQLAQTTLRWVLGKHDLDQMLAERDKLNADIQDVLDKQTEGWGVKVSNVEIKRIDLDESMVRAIARQAEAERERRAKIINAEGEFQAAQRLLDAARIIAPVPQAMQLRYLTALFDIAGDRTSTIVFPFPVELMEAFAGLRRQAEPAAPTQSTPPSQS
jgi:regulator of protease activity HflC (stomatin/prohibitin superfamily)